MKTFEIYFSDLNEDARQRLLEAVGVETAADMNWDIDMCPIAMYDFEIDADKEKEEITVWNWEEILGRPVWTHEPPALESLIREKSKPDILKLFEVEEIQEPKWIPVSERLPESDEYVLVITNDRRIYIGWIDPTDRVWRVDYESEYFMTDIIAWMPLPEPYKAESEE